MEFTLRCNTLKCRKEIANRAVVTTCSHVFCIDCANQLQLAGQRQNQRLICPACDAHLPNPDDIIITNLNPTEDYKTSVLSGLSPNVIMECASRALAFWTYQATQEIVYQEYLAKNLTDKYTSLNSQMDKVVNDANNEITKMQNQMSSLQVDQEHLKTKHEELIQAYREKNRKLMQSQELYDKLKRRERLGHVQGAAADAVDDTIQASVAGNRFVDRLGNQNSRPANPPQFSIQQENFSMQQRTNSGLTMGPPTSVNGNGYNQTVWSRFGSQGSNSQNDNQPAETPSSHRQRLTTGASPRTLQNLQNNHIASIPTPQIRTTPSRQPLAGLSANNSLGSGFAGYGLTAGMKVSNPAGAVANGLARPVIRSRVAQRPGSNFQTNRNPEFGPASNMFSNGNAYY